MTLILSATCKEGICICADKRYRVIDEASGHVESSDHYKKIYSFEAIPLAIINHGVNRFADKYWDEYCRDYEQSEQWREKDLNGIADSFKLFVEDSVVKELGSGKENAVACGFLLCGQDSNGRYRIIELFWKFGNQEVSFQTLEHQGLAVTGNGGGYTDVLLSASPYLKDLNFWRKRTISETRSELKKLFKAAVRRRKILKGEDFSDTYDIELVSSK